MEGREWPGIQWYFIFCSTQPYRLPKKALIQPSAFPLILCWWSFLRSLSWFTLSKGSHDLKYQDTTEIPEYPRKVQEYLWKTLRPTEDTNTSFNWETHIFGGRSWKAQRPKKFMWTAKTDLQVDLSIHWSHRSLSLKRFPNFHYPYFPNLVSVPCSLLCSSGSTLFA